MTSHILLRIATSAVVWKTVYFLSQRKTQLTSVFIIVRCEVSLPQRVIKQRGIRAILIHLFPAGERFLPCGGSDLTR